MIERADLAIANRGRLLVSCADRSGIVAAVSRFLSERGANIVHSDQHSTDPFGGQFFLRVEIVVVAGNHAELEVVTKPWGVPFVRIPVTSESKQDAEEEQMTLLESHRIDLVALAQYMQILSSDFVDRWLFFAINIPHSFLTAFVGANPYAQPHERGSKLIGATAHYVTSSLDAVPIIDRDVARVDHRDDVPELRRMGRQIERTILARAVSWHFEDRILVHGSKTVVFS